MLTLHELKQIIPYAGNRAEEFLAPLSSAMDEFEIDTAQRQAAFLAQVAHESGSLRYVKEIASGEAYEGREDLGNVEPGDGVKFKGRGLIQLTGRSNYARCGRALDLDLLSHPELLEEPINACRSAGWFWQTHGLNELADEDDFRKITKIINGGYTHYGERVAYYEKAKKVLA